MIDGLQPIPHLCGFTMVATAEEMRSVESLLDCEGALKMSTVTLSAVLKSEMYTPPL